MLWEAGQARVAREERARLVEAYVTTRDGILAATVPDFPVPAYLRETDPGRPDADRLRARDRTLAMLGRAFPAAVKVS